MSKLDKLIAELCPDGVEYKTIGECVEKIENIKWVNHKGETYQYIDLTSVDRDTHTILETQRINDETAPSRAQQIVHEEDILFGATRPLLKRYCYVPYNYDGEICSTGFCVLRARKSVVEPRYLYHVISTTAFFDHVEKYQRGASYPTISDADTKRYKFPAPPLEVQREIVRVLDNFTLLSAELSAELSARRKQYEYYRDQLLSFGNDIEWKTLGDIGKISMCKRIMKDETSPEGDVPFYKIGTFGGEANAFISKEVFEKYKSQYSYPKKGDILISAAGTIGRTVVFDGKPAYFQDSNIVWLANDETQVLNEFLYYWYQTSPWKISTGGTIARLYNDNIAGAKVPVMPMKVQERLIHALNNFDAVCNDLNIGLPAEINARQKQYEYYRDLLLTFAETGSSILTDRQSIIKLLQYVFGYAYVTLQDISQNCDSQRKPVTRGNRSAGEYPYYGASGIVDYVDDYLFDGDYLLISEDGANLVARVTPIAFSISGKNWVNNHAHVLKFDDAYEQRYVEIYLNGMDLSKYVSGAAQPKLNQNNLNSIPIPMPSKDEVRRIVDILDRFDKLCNNISEGIPAEIEARQKQYEYYRDSLLTFTERK